jgi:colanic acid biosynthesis glycosyl transferase WcaI
LTRRLHILSQYLWPDDAPTGIYAEHVADAVAARGVPVRLVGGAGTYRPGGRRPPRTPILKLAHWQGKRESLLSTALEYGAVHRSFARYLGHEVEPGDVVLLTSAPPTTVFLHGRVRRRGAVGIYWLQDFYPQLIRGVWDPPRFLLRRMKRAWERSLAAWDHVVKSAANLGYSGSNATVIRNWNTLPPGQPRPARPRTALYSGNLGYGHDLNAFLGMCARLRDAGYEITVRGDGPGMARLPDWVRIETSLKDPEDLVASYWEAEVHLVAGDPDLPDAIFPSKIWNSLAVGRPVQASGFAGPMAAELEVARKADFGHHLSEWVELLLSILDGEGSTTT